METTSTSNTLYQLQKKRPSAPSNENIPRPAMQDSNEVITYILDSNDLYREGLKSFFAGTEFLLSGQSEDVREFTDMDPGIAPDLIIMGMHKQDEKDAEYYSEQCIRQIQLIRTTYPKVKLVLFASADDIRHMPQVMLCNMDGYLMRDIPRKAILAYLSLAMFGEKAFPEAVAHLFAPKEGGDTPYTVMNDGMGAYNLSEREHDIVQYLALGESNKLIARHLAIAESTVKAHLKTILRKMGVQNRTQAALLIGKTV